MTADAVRSILLVDVSGLFHARWHASAGDEVNAAANSTVSCVRSYLLDSSGTYDRVVVCCDSPGGSAHRKALDPAYKATRPPADRLMLDQLDAAIRTLDGDGAHVLRAPGHEADDVIATVARWAQRSGIRATIMSDDKDFAQLVDDAKVSIALYRPREQAIYRYGDVLRKWGVGPLQIVDLLAMVGDKSDNVGGVKGVGFTRGVALLTEHGSLDGLGRALTSGGVFTPAIRAALEASRDSEGLVAGLARSLIVLREDVLTDAECAAILERKAMTTTTGDDDWDAREPDELEDVAPPATIATAPEALPPAPPAPPPPPSAPAVEGELVAPPPPSAPSAEVLPPIRSTALATVDSPFAHGLEPQSIDQAKTIAKYVFESRLFSAYGNPQGIFVAALMGRSLGLDFMTSLRAIHIIEGKPSMSAQLLIGLVLASGHAEYFTMVESTAERATFETKRRGCPTPTRLTWTLDDAKAAGLLNPTRSGKPGMWQKYQRTALRWRCGAELARCVYPDVTLGVYTSEEMSDH